MLPEGPRFGAGFLGTLEDGVVSLEEESDASRLSLGANGDGLEGAVSCLGFVAGVGLAGSCFAGFVGAWIEFGGRPLRSLRCICGLRMMPYFLATTAGSSFLAYSDNWVDESDNREKSF